MPPAKAPYKSFAQFRKVVHLIYAAMCFGLATATGLFYFVSRSMSPPDPKQMENMNEHALLIAASVVSVAAVGIAAFLPMLATSRVPDSQFALKIRSVLYSKILFVAAFEGGGLLWAILGVLFRDERYFLGPIVALAILIVFFPNTARLEAALGVDEATADRRLLEMGAGG